MSPVEDDPLGDEVSQDPWLPSPNSDWHFFRGALAVLAAVQNFSYRSTAVPTLSGAVFQTRRVGLAPRRDLLFEAEQNESSFRIDCACLGRMDSAALAWSVRVQWRARSALAPVGVEPRCNSESPVPNPEPPSFQQF